MLGEVKVLQTLTKHSSDINSVDFAGDYILVTGSGDKLVRVWEWECGHGYSEARFSPLKGHKYGVTCVKISPQSTMLASSSIDGTTLLWNLRTGVKLHRMVQTGGEAVRVCKFSSDSTLLATAGDNGQVCLWDLIRRTLIRSFQKHEGAVQSICFSPDSNWLVTSCTFGVLQIFSTAEICDTADQTDNPTINVYDSIDDAHDLGVVCCDISTSHQISNSDSPYLTSYSMVTCGNDHQVKLWEIRIMRMKPDDVTNSVKISLEKVLEKHSSALTCVRFSGNGSYIASCGLDKITVLWEARTGKILTTISGHSRYVSCCAFSRSDNLLATGSNDKSTIVWDLTGNLSTDSQLANRNITNSGALSSERESNQDTMMKHEQDLMENAEILENEVQLIQRLDEHCAPVNSVGFYGNHLIACGTGDKQVRIWANDMEHQSNQILQTDQVFNTDRIEESDEPNESDEQNNANEGSTSQVTKAVQNSANGQISQTDLNDQTRFYEKSFSPLEGHKYSVNYVEFSPCGRMLASCSLDGTTIIWDTESLLPTKTTVLNTGYGVRVCRWSPDGERIATAGDDERATLWSANNAELLCFFEGHADAVTSLAFTHDSRYLVTGCNDGVWRLFDVTHTVTTSCLAILICEEAHDLGVQACDFSPISANKTNSKQVQVGDNCLRYLLATGGNDSLVKLWQLTDNVRNEATRANTSANSESMPCFAIKKSLTGHGGNVTNVRFSPVHGDIIASVATDRTARIWSVLSAVCLHVLEGHDSLVTTCAFSKDTSLLITGSLDRSIFIWKLPQRLVSQATLINSLRHSRKKLDNWQLDDTLHWLTEIGLSSLTRSAHAASLTGRQLLSLSFEDLIAKLGLTNPDQRLEILERQLYWLKCANGNATVPLDDARVPHHFLCPITHEIMKEPVECSDGFTYEKAAISEWFLCGKYSSPMTNECLQQTTFKANVSLRNDIYTFLYGNGPLESC